MKLVLVLLSILAWPAISSEPIVVPKVEHKQKQSIQTYDEVTRSCPDGYEGHFVDQEAGFDWQSGRGWGGSNLTWGSGGIYQGEPGYTICFKKEFMDKVRKDSDLLAPRPAPPRGV